jgi:hypothetical protein
MHFDPKSELIKLQIQTKSIRKTSYSPSRLDRYKTELLLLRKEGASIAELQRWLRSNRVKVAWSTVSRWTLKHA